MANQPSLMSPVTKDEHYRAQHNIDSSLHIVRYKRQIIFEKNGIIEREDRFEIKIVQDVMHVDWVQDFLLSQDAFIGSLKENITASDNDGQLQVQTTPKDNLVRIVIKYRQPLVKGDSLTFWYRCRYRSNFTKIEATFRKHIFISGLLVSAQGTACDCAVEVRPVAV